MWTKLSKQCPDALAVDPWKPPVSVQCSINPLQASEVNLAEPAAADDCTLPVLSTVLML